MSQFDIASPQYIQPIINWLNERVESSAHLVSDSRQVREGDVYCAYVVDGVDNRAFIADACQRGAKAILCSEAIEWNNASVAYLEVPHLGELMGSLASFWYKNVEHPLWTIGVTGTNGKTSCTQWIAAALTILKKPCAVIGTLGSGILDKLVSTGFTTPDACCLQKNIAQCVMAGAKAMAIEVSSHALQQGRVNGVPFNVAVFTNLTQDHLDYHETLEAYEAAKARLFAWPSLQAVVINRDDAAGQRLLAGISPNIHIIEYGFSDAEHIPVKQDRQYVFAKHIIATARGMNFKLDSSWGTAVINSPIIGQFNISNLLAVFAVLMLSNTSFERAISILQRLQPVEGRMQQLGGKAQQNEPLVVIDYAHTPDALEKVLAVLKQIADARQGKLLCVFGCGGNRDAAKRPIMGKIATRLADHVIVTSDNPRYEDPQMIIDQILSGAIESDRVSVIEDRARAILKSIKDADKADVILIAGKGHETTQEINGEKRRFSDQEHTLLALATRMTQVKRGEK